MKAIPTAIPEVLILEPQVFGDERCFFFESFKRRQFVELTWRDVNFSHGFVAISDTAKFLYKTTDYWALEFERCIARNDKTLNIKWTIEGSPEISAKDAQGQNFVTAEVFA